MTNCTSALALLIATLAMSPALAQQEAIEVESVLVTVVEQVEVPAREAGVLAQLAVKEGDMVEDDALLAQIDDTDARLSLVQADVRLNSVKREAENTVKVRSAKKSLALAQAELQRAEETRKLFPKTISQAEIDKLNLLVSKAELDVEQAEHDLELAQFVLQASRNDVQIANRGVERRRIVAPLSGLVVEINRRKGEWVEPGQPVMRILRMNRLHAEGFVHADDLRGELAGRPVRLHVRVPSGERAEFPGTLSFVSPEINPVDGRVHVRAEVENTNLRLRPGMRGSMTIERTSPPAN